MSSISKDIAKKIKNIIIIVLLYMVLLAILFYVLFGNNLEEFSSETSKNTIETSGQCGEHVFWELDDKQLIIEGSGPMENFREIYDPSDENKTSRIAPWIYDYDSSIEIKTIVIKPGVTSIGKNAFWGLDVEQVIIPDGITTIEDEAFFFMLQTF